MTLTPESAAPILVLRQRTVDLIASEVNLPVKGTQKRYDDRCVLYMNRDMRSHEVLLAVHMIHAMQSMMFQVDFVIFFIFHFEVYSIALSKYNIHTAIFRTLIIP